MNRRKDRTSQERTVQNKFTSRDNTRRSKKRCDEKKQDETRQAQDSLEIEGEVCGQYGVLYEFDGPAILLG